MNVQDYIKKLLSYEEYSFSLDEIIKETDKTEISIKRELSRLIEKQQIVNLRKGFYIILTPRYSSTQKLPIQLYCEKLFRHLNRNYYLGFYTAAKIHGASHQQVHRDYIMNEKPKFNNILRNAFDIRFFTTSNWSDKNIQIKKSDAGIYKVSSPALTIVDLIHYQTKLGGINRMLTTIEELSEEIDEQDLDKLLKWYPYKSTLQRFGFILDEIGNDNEINDKVFYSFKSTKLFPVLLSPKSNTKPGSANNRWKVDINVKLEQDI